MGRELEPLSFFSPLAQQILVEPEKGWGYWDKHFWILVMAMFYRQQNYSVTELCGEMLSHDNVRKYDRIIPQLDLRCLQLLSLEFTHEHHWSLVPN